MANEPVEKELEENEDQEASKDPDDIELAELEEALAKEESGEDGEATESEGEEAETGEAEPAPADTAESGDTEVAEPAAEAKPQPVMIPKERFDEVLAKSEENARLAAYYKGVADAAKVAPGAAGHGEQQQAEPLQTPDDQLAAARSELLDLAEKYDEGEMTAREYEEAKLDVQDRMDGIREEARQIAMQQAEPQQPQQQRGEDLYLAQQTANLVEEHPYLSLMNMTGDSQRDGLIEHRMATLRDEAIMALEAEGIRIMPGSEGTYVLRQKVAELTDAYGPIWYPDAKFESQQPAQEQRAPGELSQRQRQTDAKIRQAEKHPPDTLNLGSGDTDTEETVNQVRGKIESGELSDEDIAALPDSILSKVR